MSVSVKSYSTKNKETYTKVDYPKIDDEIPTIDEAFPVPDEITTTDPHVQLLANIDHLVSYTPWSYNNSFIEYPIFTSNTLVSRSDYISIYKRYRLLSGIDYQDTDITTNLILNFDLNPLQFNNAIKKYVKTRSDIILSVVYKPNSPVSLNFMYLLAQVSSKVNIIRPYMLSGMGDICIIIGFKKLKIMKATLNDVVESRRLKYDNIPSDFGEYVKKMLSNVDVDDSRGWSLVSYRPNLEIPRLVSS